MLEQILNGLFFGFLIYMLIGVVFALLRSPRFYEFVLLVAAPLGTYHCTNDFQTVVDGPRVLRTLCCPCGYGPSTRAQAGPKEAAPTYC
jgi:hypothetical protein